MAAAVQGGESTAARFGRLMDAVEFGEVVPFLGAGISSSAKAPAGIGHGGRMHGYSMAWKLEPKVFRACRLPGEALQRTFWRLVNQFTAFLSGEGANLHRVLRSPLATNEGGQGTSPQRRSDALPRDWVLPLNRSAPSAGGRQ